MSIQLEAGKQYISRSGWTTPPLEAIGHKVFKFGITSNIIVMHSWMIDGTAAWSQKGDDLIAEMEVKSI